jgi:hypothetical protein
MTLLRENVAFLQNNDPTVDEMNYSQALHRLIREFLESPMGASNLGFAGLVPLLVELLKIERTSVWNIAVTTADLLASLIPHHRQNQILPLFLEADGLNTVIAIIRKHVDFNIANGPQEEEPGIHHSFLSFPEHQLLHTFLLLLNRLVKSGHGERVRAVVDSPVIPSIRGIFKDLPLFGGFIAWQASKLLSLILHNEPTSYPALHENGLPQAFLEMVASGIPPVPDFIQSLPTVFDAICINAQGKELFLQHGFQGLFDVFKSLEHCRVLVKGHAMECGGGIDELLRHHPDLKEPYLHGSKDFLRAISLIIAEEKPQGAKLPVMVDVEGAEVADADWRASMRPGLYLTMARMEEERNLPVLQRIRAIVHVRLLWNFTHYSTWMDCFRGDIGSRISSRMTDTNGSSTFWTHPPFPTTFPSSAMDTVSAPCWSPSPKVPRTVQSSARFSERHEVSSMISWEMIIGNSLRPTFVTLKTPITMSTT